MSVDLSDAGDQRKDDKSPIDLTKAPRELLWSQAVIQKQPTPYLGATQDGRAWSSEIDKTRFLEVISSASRVIGLPSTIRTCDPC